MGFKKTSLLVSHSAITFDATFSEILYPVGSANVGSASLKESLDKLGFPPHPRNRGHVTLGEGEIGDVDTSDGD